MSPFQKNLQKVLMYFFSAISIIIVIMGIGRAKKSNQISIAPDQPIATGQNTTPVTTIPATLTQVAGVSTTTGLVEQATTFSGSAYQTPWGNTVASVSVANGKITGVTMPTVPNSPPSVYAESYLVQQALAAGSANIQGVSGATYTSIAFKSSLESAIAKANQTAEANGKAAITANPASTVSGASATPAPSVPRKYRDDDKNENEDEDEGDDESDDFGEVERRLRN